MSQPLRNILLGLFGFLLLPISAANATLPTKWESVNFDLIDSREVFKADLAPKLELHISKTRHARLENFGWKVSVFKKSSNTQSRDLLLSRWHGPHPSDVLAWISRNQYYPDERTLDVPGYPYEVRIRLFDVMTETIGEYAVFKNGRCEVSWRKVAAASPSDPSE